MLVILKNFTASLKRKMLFGSLLTSFLVGEVHSRRWLTRRDLIGSEDSSKLHLWIFLEVSVFVRILETTSVHKKKATAPKRKCSIIMKSIFKWCPKVVGTWDINVS